MVQTWETVIGLEVHAQLLTESKLFCGCSTRFGSEPNTNVCATCLGLPGSLPVLNRRAVEMAIVAALALGCTVHENSVFARKNYFYPDLPKGYQISQYERPLSSDGHLDIETEAGTRRIGIIRIHMEEDAGKNVHGVGGDSLVDLNRAGVPLIEIVGAPDLRSAGEAQAYMKALRDVVVFLGINDGNLEEGSFRCDANVSVRPTGSDVLGTRAEVKNLNSFRFLARAIEIETQRQVRLLEAGGHVEQETRGYDAEAGRTYSLRSKEEAHDYRYFPEPDLPALIVDRAMRDRARGELVELPASLRERFVSNLSLSKSITQTLTQHPELVRFFEATTKLGAEPIKAANWITTEVLRDAKFRGLAAEFAVSPAQLAELIALIDTGEISGKQAKEVFSAISGNQKRPREIVTERNMRVVSDAGALRPLCEKIVLEHPAQAAQVRAGKKGVLGFFVGQVMKATGGSADPKLVSSLIAELIEKHAGGG